MQGEVYKDLFSEPNVLLPDALDISLGFSITNERLLWHSLVNLFGALAGLCHFLGIVTSYVIGKTCKESNQKAGKTQKSSPSPFPFFHNSPRTHKRRVNVSARSQGLAYHQCLQLKCTTSRCRCHPGWAWASTSQRRRAERSQARRIHQLEYPCHRWNLASWASEGLHVLMQCAHSRWQGASKPEWSHEHIGRLVRRESSEAPRCSSQPRSR